MRGLGFFAGMFMLASVPASAATFTYTSATVYQPGTVNITAPNNIGGVNAGQIVLNATIGADILAWCLDIYGTLVQSDTMNTSALTVLGAGGSNPLLSLGQIQDIGSLMNRGDALLAGAHAAETSAAIQLSIWRVEYANLAFTTSAAIKNLSDTFMGYVALGGIWDCPTCGVTKMVGTYPDRNQVLGTGFDTNPLTTVPVPPALVLFGSGLVGLAVIARRRKAKVAKLAAA